MFSTTVAILGGDLRQCYLADYMYAMGHDVTCYGTMSFSYKYKNYINVSDCLKEAVSPARFILGPVPFSKNGQYLYTLAPDAEISMGVLLDFLRPGQILVGGNLPEDFLLSSRERQVTTIDFMEDTTLLEHNAALTAEGLLSWLITETPFSLFGKKVLLLGLGRCGQEIGKLLSLLDLRVSAYDQKSSALAAGRRMGMNCLQPEDLSAEQWEYDIILNTIPAQVIAPRQYKLLRQGCILFDIASTPGFDETALKALDLRLVKCPGIPGRFMPQTAGELIGKSILERMLSHGF